MFEDSLIESGRKLRTKRGVTASISFLLELGLVTLLVLLPLLFTKALPSSDNDFGSIAPATAPGSSGTKGSKTGRNKLRARSITHTY
ncbi:MAG: hypothetical protein NVS1B11_02800 [Terriglobales bacterium]